MTFKVSRSGNPSFTGIHPLLADILRCAVEDPWERCPEGSLRLLPSPGSDEELCGDWEDHVKPGLRLQFETSRDVVAGDLQKLRQSQSKNASWSLEIPKDHRDEWLSTLNAIRLALAAEQGFGEGELSRDGIPDLSTERGIALMRVNFYAFVQECLIRSMDDGDPVSGKSDRAD